MTCADQSMADLPDGVYDSFESICNICGGIVDVVDTTRQPHLCRLKLSTATEEGS